MRVVIVDNFRLFGEALETVLRAEGIEATAVTTAEEAVVACGALDPDMILVDLDLPGDAGLELGRRLAGMCPGARVVTLSATTDVRAGKTAIHAGLSGYMTKDIGFSELLKALHAVAAGRVVLPPDAEPRRVAKTGTDLLAAHLTPRERDILRLLVEGASSKEMARRFSLRPNTVRTHVQNVLTKLQVHSRLEAASVAVRYGIVPIDGPESSSPSGLVAVDGWSHAEVS